MSWPVNWPPKLGEVWRATKSGELVVFRVDWISHDFRVLEGPTLVRGKFEGVKAVVCRSALRGKVDQ